MTIDYLGPISKTPRLLKTFKDPERIKKEASIVESCFGGMFREALAGSEGTAFYGTFTTYNKRERVYFIMLKVSKSFPLKEPVLIVNSTERLRMFNSSVCISDLGASDDFLTHGAYREIWLRIRFCDRWDSSISLARALMAGCFWLDAYSQYILDGRMTFHQRLKPLSTFH